MSGVASIVDSDGRRLPRLSYSTVASDQGADIWTTWPQPIPCLSAFQWHARKISSQPEKDTTEVQYTMSGVASVVDSDGRRLTRGSGL
uniref:YD repeat-containing protein n=1 Tax=Mesocestoides corti TaxID=53468 RepID=A0A5K3FY99_MESCO